MPTTISKSWYGTDRSRVAGYERQPAHYSPQECPPPCPACGDIECFCRPRFFAGQLLTDEDLTRLDHYIVEKNKLHNRYLHGHGIVCGLDIVCNPCDPKGVIVKTGYALSPCGDDIVICKDTPVPICDLINQCRPVSQPECDPMHPAPTDICPEGEQEWVLAVCYDEKPSRGTAALRADVMAPCCSQCASGGSSSCGCRCHPTNGSGQQQKAAVSSQNKKRPVECEPTLTCETYKFLVYRYQEKTTDSRVDDNFTKKIAYVSARLPQPPSDTAALTAWANYGNNYRDVVWGSLSETLCVSDDDKRKLAAMSAPDAAPFARDPAGYVTAVKAYVGNVTVYLMYYLLLLLCQNLKPSCAGRVDRNCVPLARVRVRKPECRVVSICEVSVREYVLSALLEHFYWPIRSWLPTALGALCCDRIRQVPAEIKGKQIGDKIAVLDDTARANARNALEGRGPKPLASKTLVESSFANRDRSVDLETLALGLLGAKDSTGNLFASPEELSNPAAFLLASQFLRPTVEAALPESWSGFLQVVSKLNPKDTTVLSRAVQSGGAVEELAGLRDTIGALRDEIKSQQQRIQTLETRVGTTRPDR